jgi:3-deoxy-D-arabino-heptulosonate 7-phosphate (DAHP) synthase class II
MPVCQLSHAPRSWRPAAWRELPATQQPAWPDAGLLREVTGQLAASPPLTSADHVSTLRQALAQVAVGDAFVVQAGDCAETLDIPGPDEVAADPRLSRHQTIQVARCVAELCLAARPCPAQGRKTR